MNIDKYKNIWFFAPDEGGGEGGGGEISHGAAALEPADGETTTTTTATGGGEGAGSDRAGTGEAAAQFDASKFAKEFGASFSESIKPILERTKPEKELTQEEARKLLNFWEPDENWYKSYDNLETRNDAVLQMRDALILQADTLAQMRLNEAIETLKNEFMPHLTSMTQAENARREERFNTQYKQLAKPELKPLVRAIAQDLVDRNQRFNSEAELFKALASGVEAVIKVNNPDFKLEAADISGQQNEDRGGRRLPVMTPGGGGGTGRRESGTKTEKPRGLSIFDK